MIGPWLHTFPRRLFRLTGIFLLVCIAVPFVVLGFAVRPLCACIDDTRRTLPRQIVEAYAGEAYAWSMDNPGSRCPTDASELARYTGDPDADGRDPWGNDLVIVCDAPGGRFGVVSVGEDGKQDTPDDIRSWDPAGPDR
jgi:hypothetical protein